MARKSDTKAKVIIALFSFLGIAIGTFGTLLIDYLKPKDVSIGTVQNYDHVYLFIRSEPLSKNYTLLQTVNTNVLSRAVESGTNKKGWDILKNVSESLLSDISFESRLRKIVEDAKRQYPTVDGLIFPNDLTECQIIKFR